MFILTDRILKLEKREKIFIDKPKKNLFSVINMLRTILRPREEERRLKGDSQKTKSSIYFKLLGINKESNIQEFESSFRGMT